MELTKEQQDRIQRNRERALLIRKQKLEEENQRLEEEYLRLQSHKQTIESVMEEEGKLELEGFEEGASEFVTKQEATKMYCLPAGTLAVCGCIEKPNPRNTKFQPMKLYRRAELRRRARHRYGGLAGLQAERQKRIDKKFQKDLEATKDIFRS